MPEITISGTAGRLEGRFSPGAHPHSPIGLFLHPHPQHGGTMNNKVVFTLERAFRDRGFATLRFNFRGVGLSQGHFDRGDGELSDAASALDWLRAHCPDASQCWIAGFSFGAWIAMQLLMRRPGIHRFVVVAPPANLMDFGFLAPCPASGLIIQGDQDDIVPEPDVARLVDTLSRQPDIHVEYQVIPGADHFFGDRMDDLIRSVKDYVSRTLPGPAT
jgi:alpha/beta superfamily hydrolase